MEILPVLLRGAVQITPASVRYSVVAEGPNATGTVTSGHQEVDAAAGGFDRVEAAVEDGVRAVRDSGAETVELFVAPELKGSRVAGLLAVKAGRLGVGKVRFTGTGASAAASFISRTGDLGFDPDEEGQTDHPESPCGVLGIGHHSVGLAVGQPGRHPEWIGSRPVGIARLAERSRISDPPEPAQLAAVRSAVERALGGFACPAFGSLVSVSDFSPATRNVIGRDSADAVLLGEVLDSFTGMTSDEISARTGLGPVLSPRFTIALVVQSAAARTFDTVVIPRDPDPADFGRVLAGLSDVGV